MSKTIVMRDTACGPNGNFQAGSRQIVGVHISKDQAADFVKHGHAAYVDEAAEAKAEAKAETAEAPGAPETAAERTGRVEPKGKK